MDAPAVAVNADGKLIAVAWMDMRRRRNERDAFWRLIEKGKPKKAEPLGPDAGEQGHAALAIDEKDVVHAVWESDGKILYRNGGGEPREIGAGGQPSLAYRGGVLAAAYESGGGAMVKRIEFD